MTRVFVKRFAYPEYVAHIRGFATCVYRKFPRLDKSPNAATFRARLRLKVRSSSANYLRSSVSRALAETNTAQTFFDIPLLLSAHESLRRAPLSRSARLRRISPLETSDNKRPRRLVLRDRRRMGKYKPRATTPIVPHDINDAWHNCGRERAKSLSPPR